MTVQRMDEMIRYAAQTIAGQRSSDDIRKLLDKYPHLELDRHILALTRDEKQALVIDETDLDEAIEESLFCAVDNVGARSEWASVLVWRIKQKSWIVTLKES